MRKWLVDRGMELTKLNGSQKSKEKALADAYLALVEAAYIAGIDLDAAVNAELEARRGRKIG